MKISFLTFIFCCLTIHFVNAQTLRAYEKAGDKAMDQQDYYSAYVYYVESINLDSSITRLKYKFAKAAYYWQSYDEAEAFFQQANRKKLTKENPSFEYDWALNYIALGNYEAAIKQLKQFLKKGRTNPKIRKKAKNKIKACENANTIINQPVEVEIKHLDKTINSPYADFAPFFKNGMLYYSALKFKETKKGNENYYARILSKKEGENARQLRGKMNLKSMHTAHTTFSRDEKWIYFTRCLPVETGGIRCQIYRRDLSQKRPKDELLPDFVNLKGFTATHPNIGWDSISNKEWLFFTSDRTGGRGGLDIWMSEIKKDGNFTKPKNLGRRINTDGNDITPFFDSKKQLLYFSSNEWKGLGGYDIFKSKKTKHIWSNPKNMGFPLNSSYNDIYYVLNENGYSGYFSSNRKGTILLTKSACCNDIFAFTFPKPKEKALPPPPKTDTLVVINENPKPIDLPIDTPIVTPPSKPIKTVFTFEEELSRMLPIALYFDNDHPNPRTTKVSTNKSYGETFHAYYTKKELFAKKYAAPLKRIQKEEAIIEMNAFFENEVKNGFDDLERLSALLLIELQKGRKISIYIKGYTSQLASSNYNTNLSKRRIYSVINHLKRVNSRVLSFYIESGQLKIEEVSFGEAQSKEHNTAKEKRISVFSVGASSERRVEILEVK